MNQRIFTDEILDDRMAEILRAKTAGERLAIVAQLWDLAALLVRDMARAQHPNRPEAEIARYVAQRMSHGAF